MNAQAKDRALQDEIYTRTLPHCTGITGEQARTLRRAQLTLHRWAEEECNGTIQREELDVNDAGETCADCEAAPGAQHSKQCRGGSHRYEEGRPFRHYDRMFRDTPQEELRRFIPDRERGALARVAKVCKEAGLHFYHQGDPRGCALYVATFPLDHSNYDRGIPCL